MSRRSQGIVRALVALAFFYAVCCVKANTPQHAEPGTITRSPITIIDTVTFHAPSWTATGAQPTGLSSSTDDPHQAQLDNQHMAASVRALKRFVPQPTPILARVLTSIRQTFDALVVQLWPWFHPVETPTLPAPPPQVIYLLPAPPPVLVLPPVPWWEQVLRAVGEPSLLQRVLLCLLFFSCAATYMSVRYRVPAFLHRPRATSTSSKAPIRHFKRVSSISTDVAKDQPASKRKLSQSGAPAEVSSSAYLLDDDEPSPPHTPTRSTSSQESTPRSVRNSWASTTTPAGLSLAESIASFVSSDLGWQHISDGSSTTGSRMQVDDVFMSLKLRGSSISPNSSPTSISQPMLDVSQVWEKEGVKGKGKKWDDNDDWTGPGDRSKEDRAAAEVQLLFDAALAASEQWSKRSSDGSVTEVVDEELETRSSDGGVVDELEEELGHSLEEIPSEEEPDETHSEPETPITASYTVDATPSLLDEVEPTLDSLVGTASAYKDTDNLCASPTSTTTNADQSSSTAGSSQPSDMDTAAPSSPLGPSTPPSTRSSRHSESSSSHRSCGLPVRQRDSTLGTRRRNSDVNSIASDDSFSVDAVSSCSGSPSPGSAPSAGASSPSMSPSRPARSSRLPTPAKSTPLRSSASTKSAGPSPSTSSGGPTFGSPIPMRFPRATSESLESSWESVPSPNSSPTHRRTDSQTRLPRRSIGATPASPSSTTDASPSNSSSPLTQRFPSGQTRLPRRSVSSRAALLEADTTAGQ